MKEIDFLDAVGRVDKKYIEECINIYENEYICNYSLCYTAEVNTTL